MFKSRFNNTADYFKNIRKVSEKALAFVRKPGKRKVDKDMPTYTGKVFAVAIREDHAQAWDELNINNPILVYGSDGMRFHAAIVPQEYLEGDDIEPYAEGYGIPPFHKHLPEWTGRSGLSVSIDPRLLKDAIHPDAERVNLFITEPVDNSTRIVTVASLTEGGAQIGWATLAALSDSRTEYHDLTPDFVMLDDLLAQLEKERKEEERKRKAEEKKTAAAIWQEVIAEEEAAAQVSDLPLFREASRIPNESMPV